MSGRLTEGFRDLMETRWNEFIEIEEDVGATNFESVVTGLVRACQKGNLRAIQTALDRLDGKIATELEVEYPKFYYVYPNATKAADDPTIIDVGEEEPAPEVVEVSGAPADMDELHASEEEMPTGSLRAVLDKMLDSPKDIVTDILATAEKVELGDLSSGNPMVKSVIIAGLMKLVHEGRMSAVFEVLEQIDGKVAEKVKVLGNDVFVKQFATIAPAGAVKNEDGIYQIEAPQMTNTWNIRLGQGDNR